MESQPLTKIAELEALLFYYGEPLEVLRIAKLLGVSRTECETMINDLDQAISQDVNRGCGLMRTADRVQLVTKPDLKSIGQKLLQEEFREQLTPAGLETLALIAYLGPVQRSTIDYIRGVNSSFTFRNLLMRGLVDRKTHPEKKNVYLYEASFDFLKHVGLERVQELPEYERFVSLLKDFESQQAAAQAVEEPTASISDPASSEPLPSAETSTEALSDEPPLA